MKGEKTKPRQILQLKLSDLVNKEIAIKVHSEVLNCDVWFCGTEKIASLVKEEDPQAVIYSIKELIKLLELEPDVEEIRAIHNIKAIFPSSKIIVDD